MREIPIRRGGNQTVQGRKKWRGTKITVIVEIHSVGTRHRMGKGCEEENTNDTKVHLRSTHVPSHMI